MLSLVSGLEQMLSKQCHREHQEVLGAWFLGLSLWGQGDPTSLREPAGRGKPRPGRSLSRVWAADSGLHVCLGHLPAGKGS